MSHMSILDPEGALPVNNIDWVVGIFRKPGGEVSEHAFILVEGSNPGGQVVFKRYDLFMDKSDPDHYTINIGDDKSSAPTDGIKILLEILNYEETEGKCWSVSKKKALQLHAIVLAEQKNPGIYNLLGDVASLPKTAGITHGTTSEGSQMIVEKTKQIIEPISGKQCGIVTAEALKPSGHNCFTWARNVLHRLEILEIQRDLPNKAEDAFVSITSHYLNNRNEETGTRCQLF